jgi:NitT/TauT family transport system permease protein
MTVASQILADRAGGAPISSRDIGPRRPRRFLRRLRIGRGAAGHWSLRALSLGLALALWQLAASKHVDLGIVQFRNVPTPAEVASAAATLLGSAKVIHHLGNSLFRVFAGFAIAALLGVGLGLVIGRSKRAGDLLLPILEVTRPIPGVAWIPLAILMFPSSELSMVFITFLGALFPILLNTIHGVEGLDPRVVAGARALGARSFRLFREVILPGALPSVVTGLSIGMGTAWFCLVTAEMIAGQYGIGYYTWESYNLQQYPDIVVGMLLIGLFGLLSSAAVKQIGGWLIPWHRARAQTR